MGLYIPDCWAGSRLKRAHGGEAGPALTVALCCKRLQQGFSGRGDADGGRLHQEKRLTVDAIEREELDNFATDGDYTEAGSCD